MASLWLPAANDEDLVRSLRAFLTPILADWFSKPGPIEIMAGRLPGRGKSYARRFGELTLMESELPVLGRSVCNGVGDLNNLADLPVLQLLGEKVIHEIGGAIEAELALGNAAGVNAAPASRSSPDVQYRLRRAGDSWTIAIALNADAVTLLRKKVAGKNRRLPPPVPLVEAIGDVCVALGGHLGHAHLSAREISTLAEGDLIVLDGIVADPVDITVNDRPKAGKVRVARSGDMLKVTLTAPVRIERKPS